MPSPSLVMTSSVLSTFSAARFFWSFDPVAATSGDDLSKIVRGTPPADPPPSSPLFLLVLAPIKVVIILITLLDLLLPLALLPRALPPEPKAFSSACSSCCLLGLALSSGEWEVLPPRPDGAPTTD